LAKRLHPRSPVAQRTAGITLDHAAPVYDWLAPLMTLGSEHRLHRRVVADLALDRPASVLDVGCGTGTLTRQIYDALPASAPRRVCGVDAAEAMIEVARKKAGQRPGLEFAAALAEELPYPDGSFDRVLSTFFFHHLNYGLKVKALAEIWRALRPGGQAAILDVDVPYTLFGKICAWSGYWLFQQAEIAENIAGKLRDALEESPWRGHWNIASRHSGYLSLFTLVKPQENKP
jgi:ubiquinone/menaquinone biosynthesis C-methylase UbiE